MKFLNNILFYISVGLLSLTACSKSTELSEANYKYNPVNVLTISTDTNSYDVFQFDSLYIKTNIVESKPSNSTFEYEWKALSNEKATLLSTDRDLKISVGLAPGSYNLQYTVTDKSNGLQFNRLYNLKVNSGFNSGWFVTHNKNNKAGLSFIRTDKTVFSAPAEDANNKSFSGKALRTYYAFLNNQPNYASILYFTTEGVYRFDPNNFAQVGDTQTILPTVSSFTSPNYTISSISTDQYIIDNGNLYAGIGIFHPAEILKPFSPRFEGDYELFNQGLIATSLTTYFYDNKYKRFMTVMYNTRSLNVAVATTSAVFDMSNVGKTMIAADYGAKVANDANIYCVMDDSDGRYLMSIMGAKPKYNQKVSDATSPNFSKATLFTSTGTALEQLYYAYENKIYLYDIPNNNASLIYEFPSSAKVTSLVMDKSTGNVGKTLAVGVMNNGVGEVYFFNINTLGWFTNNTFDSSFKGFGEVIHLSKKF